MKRYHPGASVKSDFYSVCDCCEVDDGRAVLSWNELPDRKGHFALCFTCLKSLFISNFSNLIKEQEKLSVVRKRIPEDLRNSILSRDGNACKICGSTEGIQIDHIIPFSLNGSTDEDNLQCLCKSCNSRKRNHYGINLD